MKRRLLALLLALAMVLAMAPVGAMAEEADTGAADSGSGSTYVSATARLDYWTEVEVEGYVSEWDRRGLTELTLVAASYDYWQMLDSAYVKIPMEDVEEGSFSATLQLQSTFDQNNQVRVFLLDQDLQLVYRNDTRAQWEQPLHGLDGDVSWSLTSGTLTLSGLLNLLSDMTPGSHQWDAYSSRIERVVTENIRNISDGAFQGYEKLYSVELGQGLETVGACAFANDSALMGVTLPASVTAIGESAFEGISQWTRFDIAEGFDWDNVTIGSGNDLLEALRPTVDSTEDLTEVPGPTEALDAAEPTEETVPESTEETVPAETKETVPEETEAQAGEAPDYSGYYIAPEGARLQEEAALEEIAAYYGTDKEVRGGHTAAFTGLIPLQAYLFIASRNPGSLEKEDLQYIGFTASDAEGKASVDYIPKEEVSFLVQLYGPEALTLEVNQDHVTLHPGESFTLAFTSNCDIDIWANMTCEYLDLYANEDGTWTLTARADTEPTECLTTYVEFCGNNGSQTLRTRVRVDLVPDKTHVTGVTLGETKLTRNLYDSGATQIPILLDLSYPVTQAESQEADGTAAFGAEEQEAQGRLIRTVTFSDAADPAAKDLFQVTAQDDRTLLLTAAPGLDLTDAALVKAVKSSYKLGFHLEFADGEAMDTGLLTLTVQKKLPTLKAGTVTLNPYYNAQEFVTFTGGTVLAVDQVVTALPGVELGIADDGTLTLFLTEAPTKAASKSLVILARVEGYSVPVKVTIPVKLDVKAPACKLETTSWTIIRNVYDNIGIPIQWTDKNVDPGDMTFGVPTVYDSKGNVCDGYSAFLSEGSQLRINTVPDDIRPAGKQTLTVSVPVTAKDADPDTPVTAPLTFKVTVTNRDLTLKLAKSSITLNAVDLDNVEAIVGMDVTLGGEPVSTDGLNFRYGIANDRFGDNDDILDFFNIQVYSEGAIGIQLNLSYLEQSGYDFGDIFALPYTLFIDAMGDDSEIDNWAKLTIHLGQDPTELTGLKATGTIDRINSDSFVTLAATYRNSWGNRVPGVQVTDSKGADCTERFVWDYGYNTDTIRLYANVGENLPDTGKYTVTLTNYSLGVTTSKSASFTVKATKPALKVTGKLDSLRDDAWALLSSNYRQLDADGQPIWPEVSLYTAGKRPTEVDTGLYQVVEDGDTGNIRVSANPRGQALLPAGKYTVRLDYGNGTVLSAPVTAVQTAPAFKLRKASATIHPRFSGSAWLGLSLTNASAFGNKDGVEYYRADGKTLWADQDLIKVALDPAGGYVQVTPTGNEPDKDTTVKVKLLPDTRLPGKFTWLTVKVLGGKNLTQKVAVKALSALDPSYVFPNTDLQCTLKGFDNSSMEGTVQLLVSYDRGKTYEPADCEQLCYAFGSHGSLGVLDTWTDGGYVPALDPSLKYRVQVTYGEESAPAAIGTADLKVAFSSNKFTVAKAPTLYKQDPYEPMDIHLNARSLAQQIDRVTVKGNTGFTVSQSVVLQEEGVSGSQYDWVLRYTGQKAKLKTTSLTLQIFLKGNTTAKPNATATVKVTVK